MEAIRVTLYMMPGHVRYNVLQMSGHCWRMSGQSWKMLEDWKMLEVIYLTDSFDWSRFPNLWQSRFSVLTVAFFEMVAIFRSRFWEIGSRVFSVAVPGLVAFSRLRFSMVASSRFCRSQILNSRIFPILNGCVFPIFGSRIFPILDRKKDPRRDPLMVAFFRFNPRCVHIRTSCMLCSGRCLSRCHRFQV